MLGTYVNGNTIVSIYEDGTKVRYTKDDEPSRPAYPESIDLKITNRCSMGCPMCAEKSTPKGHHANLTHPILDTLHPYTELAIGGGNPLEHPHLIDFLEKMKEKKVICNLTVNAEHFVDNFYVLDYMRNKELIHGLGVSVVSSVPEAFFNYAATFKNLVVHTIAGYTPAAGYKTLMDHDLNLLILGFKDKGEGLGYKINHPAIVNKREDALTEMLLSLVNHFKAVAFDNLAVEQLKLKDKIPEEEFNKLYMGDDGEFTMYIDLVKGVAGKSSTHTLKPFRSETIEDLFKEIKKKER